MTFHTPLPRLPWFTRELLTHLAPARAALLVMDDIVFCEPAELVALRRAAGGPTSWPEAPGMLWEGDLEGIAAGLTAALRGGGDFRLLCAPSTHALRADHDEYTTFFSTSPGRIAAVRQAMRAGAVQEVEWTAHDP
ncbi:MAG TPA: hypothetical protein VF665_24480 [Longimicrobium sp.]|uniref:hypothetical protein n=1 Tax=Longimicrobium sp. TaxID=2029185 RepID=UPI002EDAE287